MKKTHAVWFSLLLGCGTSHPLTSIDSGPSPIDTGEVDTPDTGDLGACSNSDSDGETPASAPSTHTIHFRFQAASTAFVVANGFACEPFSLQRLDDGTPIHIASTIDYVCEGVAQLPHATFSHEIGPDIDTASSFTWDGRELSAYQTCVECGSEGAHATDFRTEEVQRPVANGSYRVTFTLLDRDTSDCIPEGYADEGEGGDSCDNWFSRSQCGSDLVVRHVSADFQIDADNPNVYVDIPVE